MENYQHKQLDEQLSFPLYACSREVVKAYRPYLDKLGLTYTQYISMMVLWKEEQVSVKTLGQRLHLDSGTLTPLLKKLESKGYLLRKRSQDDERVVVAYLTEEGKSLQKAAMALPQEVARALADFPQEKKEQLHDLLHELMSVIEQAGKSNTKK